MAPRLLVALAVVLAVAASQLGCSQQPAPPAPATPAPAPQPARPATPQPAEPTPVVLASTTSTQDSGLFDVLIPAFERAHPQHKIKVVAVGTGEALKLGQLKDADVLLVHAKADEEKFVAAGFGTQRRDVMYNDFVVVGPAADPARIKAAPDATAALRAIHAAGRAGQALFVSRGDDSGTHKEERKLWEAARLALPAPASAKWYLATGQGMGETLKVASEKRAYALTDRATYLAQKDGLELAVLCEKDAGLRNQYGVIPVAGARHAAGGAAFAAWIVSPAAQKVIGAFGVARYGQPLFFPNAR